jgi:hypothetical protein
MAMLLLLVMVLECWCCPRHVDCQCCTVLATLRLVMMVLVC